ncbi:unnamed protein product [Adineta ricciae]|uniref:Uncharacterized protein n=1 Tax=Adineta ricciae TaxID=249248 RepID=A0A815IIV0_ADIRI|nr:unnamed protein product [Adineta ricciae]
MTKRTKTTDTEHSSEEYNVSSGSNANESQSFNLNNLIRSSPTESYDKSVCGSLLYSIPSNSSTEIFAYLRHSRFDAFHRSMDIHHKEIILMKNEHEQSVLQILTIHAHPYHWIRLLLMRECDPCHQDVDGYTAAHYAVERDDVEMLKALTVQFSSHIKPLPMEKVMAIHKRCLQALSRREKHGMTVFMLACQHESLRCLDYLHELNINDVHLTDNFGDTCLHYAVARRNEILIEKLLNQFNADVNAGEQARPSVLDIAKFNREQQRSFARAKDDTIEQILLASHAVSHCKIQRINAKRKRSADQSDSTAINSEILPADPSTMSMLDTARNCARIACTYESNRDFTNAREFYQRAMSHAPNDTLDWAEYSFHVATIHMIFGENQLALDLLKQALAVRQRYEKESEQIETLQRAIDSIDKTVDV